MALTLQKQAGGNSEAWWMLLSLLKDSDLRLNLEYQA